MSTTLTISQPARADVEKAMPEPGDIIAWALYPNDHGFVAFRKPAGGSLCIKRLHALKDGTLAITSQSAQALYRALQALKASPLNALSERLGITLTGIAALDAPAVWERYMKLDQAAAALSRDGIRDSPSIRLMMREVEECRDFIDLPENQAVLHAGWLMKHLKEAQRALESAKGIIDSEALPEGANYASGINSLFAHIENLIPFQRRLLAEAKLLPAQEA